jgi:hypothetical protein
MKIIDYWTTTKHIVAHDNKNTLHFIELEKMRDYLERNNFLDWHWNIHDDLSTAIQRGKLTFEQWLEERERCSLDIKCYLDSQWAIKAILDPINNILKNFKK